MPTRTATPHARRFRPLLLLVAGVLVMLAIGSGITTGASDAPCKDGGASGSQMAGRVTGATAAHEMGAPGVGARAASSLASSPRTEDVTPDGLDLELRVWKLRIEFPWLKSLPVRPGRQVVVSIFEAPAAID